ncbi:ring-1,2-phenylacetyl-CoA epoxidase subunit PaaC [Leucobacter luti]|uniref:1,2-phenylacetyl-CoA epoxidase subunit PaaC n=1 Tax=Leucobacter luti TaxID=340320 RepID=UPI00104EBD9B|nr:1,2-phenylacetyl-CoA epoxidase subunit PaaC [Leucobacter luti]MCW2287134.1 ring-1,2-phenylacetyl-CoA epoxidase subunit PaaC [Leucobacter luti]TCK41360.1 ring-1,2-phenylacetyl-CoA epoxidase subunit PaaC [Leucobacter luti]
MSQDLDTHGDVHGDVTVDELRLSDELLGTGETASADVAEYAMWLGDDALILSQQLAWWISRAPELEEDLALSNVTLDLLGHARALLHYAGTASGRSEDDLAYWRDEPEFRNCWLVEQPNGNFADTMARLFIFSAYQVQLHRALLSSTDATLQAIAGKAEREVSYHLDHAAQWVLRLAGGTEMSRERLIAAFDRAWPFVEELFTNQPLTDRLDGVVPQPSSLRAGFEHAVATVFAEAELSVPQLPSARCRGRLGEHSTRMGYILAEMQWLARRHPGASW